MRLTEEAAGDNHQATIRHAQRIIDLDPTDEAAVRIQMEAHLALGDRAAALRCYHRYAEMLERDLVVAPGEAISAMYQRLRAGAPNRHEVQGKDLPIATNPLSSVATLSGTGSSRRGTRRGRVGHISSW